MHNGQLHLVNTPIARGPQDLESALQAFCEEVEIADVFDRMILEFHSLMRLFKELLLKAAKASSTTGVPADVTRLQNLERFFAFRLFLGGHPKTGHMWPPQNRPQYRRSGQGFLLLQSLRKQQTF